MNQQKPFDVSFAKQLIEFNFWENRRVWENAIMPLTDAQFTTDTGYSWGTIQRECVHVMNGELGWLQRANSIQNAEQLKFEDFVERKKIRQQWDRIEEMWETYTTRLDDTLLFTNCTFLFRGKQIEVETWQVIFHVINHGTIHRTEILRMVAEVDKSVDFDLSMMQFLTGVFRQ